MENKLQQYRDIWYAYFDIGDLWVVTDGPIWFIASVGYYSNHYRIDQAIEHFIKEKNERI